MDPCHPNSLRFCHSYSLTCLSSTLGPQARPTPLSCLAWLSTALLCFPCAYACLLLIRPPQGVHPSVKPLIASLWAKDKIPPLTCLPVTNGGGPAQPPTPRSPRGPSTMLPFSSAEAPAPLPRVFPHSFLCRKYPSLHVFPQLSLTHPVGIMSPNNLWFCKNAGLFMQPFLAMFYLFLFEIVSPPRPTRHPVLCYSVLKNSVHQCSRSEHFLKVLSWRGKPPLRSHGFSSSLPTSCQWKTPGSLFRAEFLRTRESISQPHSFSKQSGRNAVLPSLGI